MNGHAGKLGSDSAPAFPNLVFLSVPEDQQLGQDWIISSKKKREDHESSKVTQKKNDASVIFICNKQGTFLLEPSIVLQTHTVFHDTLIRI